MGDFKQSVCAWRDAPSPALPGDPSGGRWGARMLGKRLGLVIRGVLYGFPAGPRGDALWGCRKVDEVCVEHVIYSLCHCGWAGNPPVIRNLAFTCLSFGWSQRLRDEIADQVRNDSAVRS